MVYKKLHDEVYGVNVLYFSGCKIEEAQSKARRVFKIKDELKVEATDAAAIFICDTGDKQVYIIWCSKNRDIPSIVHECTHLVFEVFKERGIPNTYPNQETFAYYLGYWIDVIITPKRAKTLKSKKN